MVPGSDFVVARTALRSNASNYYVDGRKSSFGEVTDLLKAKGVDLDNNRFLILQARSSAHTWALQDLAVRQQARVCGVLVYLLIDAACQAAWHYWVSPNAASSACGAQAAAQGGLRGCHRQQIQRKASHCAGSRKPLKAICIANMHAING